jgi:hypothetical protein
MAELDQDIDFSAAIVGATPKKAPAVVKKKIPTRTNFGIKFCIGTYEFFIGFSFFKKA